MLIFMDIFTHLTSGYFLKKNLLDKKSKFYLVFFLLAALSPDIDIIWSWSNISLHRVITHSLLLSPIFTIFISGIFYLFVRKNKKFKFKKIYFISLSWILVHIFLDYIVVWWVPLFYPFSEKYYSLNLYTYVLDPFLFLVTFSIIIFSILSYHWKIDFNKKKVVFLNFLFIFILFFRFLEWSYAWSISKLENYTKVPYIKNMSDLVFLYRYKIIERKDGFYHINYVNILSSKIFKQKIVKISNKNNLCAKMHNSFLFEESDLIWDIRYADKLKDSDSCFYWVKVK